MECPQPRRKLTIIYIPFFKHVINCKIWGSTSPKCGRRTHVHLRQPLLMITWHDLRIIIRTGLCCKRHSSPAYIICCYINKRSKIEDCPAADVPWECASLGLILSHKIRYRYRFFRVAFCSTHYLLESSQSDFGFCYPFNICELIIHRFSHSGL